MKTVFASTRTIIIDVNARVTMFRFHTGRNAFQRTNPNEIKVIMIRVTPKIRVSVPCVLTGTVGHSGANVNR